MKYKDYYAVMGLANTASQDEIKRAYRKLARKYHPDVSKEQDAEDRFKELGEAYEVLKDPEKRAAYDHLGAQWQSGQDFEPPPNWDSGFEFRGGPSTGPGFSDFFETLFGQSTTFGHAHGDHRAQSRHTKGEDHYTKAEVTLQDAILGATRQVVLQSPSLDAQGQLRITQRTLNVKIPAGVRDGQLIRLRGQGAVGSGELLSGDLYIEIAFKPDPLFRVDGADIHIDFPVTPWEIALGKRVHAPTLSGKVAVTLPTETGPDRTLRLKGRGLPGEPPGDQYLHLKVVVPGTQSEQALDCYRTLDELTDFDPRADIEGVAA